MNREVPTSWSKLNRLSVDLTDSQLLNILWLNNFSVFRFLIGALEQLKIESLDFLLFNLDDLTIHKTAKWQIFAHLDNDSTLVKTEG